MCCVWVLRYNEDKWGCDAWRAFAMLTSLPDAGKGATCSFVCYVVGALAMFGDEATAKLHTADNSGSW